MEKWYLLQLWAKMLIRAKLLWLENQREYHY